MLLQEIWITRARLETRSGEDFERSNMAGPDDAKVSPVERCHGSQPKAFGSRHDRCIHGPQRQVMVGGNEIRNPDPVTGKNRFSDEVSAGEIPKKAHLCGPSKAGLDEVRNLCHHQLRYDERTGMLFEERETDFMVAIVFVDICVKRSGIDEESYRRVSRRMISSMRRAVSRRPLRPALAAINRLRPPPPT